MSLNHEAETSGFTEVNEKMYEKSFDPRAGRVASARESQMTVMGKMAARDADLYKRRVEGSSGVDEAKNDQAEKELEKLRQLRLVELREENHSVGGEGSCRVLTEEEFAHQLGRQHQSGEGTTVAFFPSDGSKEFTEWIGDHISKKKVGNKYTKTNFVRVPEEAAANMPFINTTPCLVCFDGREIAGILDKPHSATIDIDDFCLDIDRWLAMVHGKEWD